MHLPYYYFHANLAANALFDTPVFSQNIEREFHRRLVDRLSQMRRYPMDHIPQYGHAYEVPLQLFGVLHLDPYIINYRRWEIDGETSVRIRENVFHASGHDVYFWLVTLMRRE